MEINRHFIHLYQIFDCFLPRIHSEHYLNKTIKETHLLPDILSIILFILSQISAKLIFICLHLAQNSMKRKQRFDFMRVPYRTSKTYL